MKHSFLCLIVMLLFYSAVPLHAERTPTEHFFQNLGREVTKQAHERSSKRTKKIIAAVVCTGTLVFCVLHWKRIKKPLIDGFYQGLGTITGRVFGELLFG